MLLIKSLITFLIVWIAVLAAAGFHWWGNPPEKLASSQNGGKLILVVLIAGCVLGLVRLWRSGPSSYQTR